MSDFYRVWGRRVTDDSFQYDCEGSQGALESLFAYVEHAGINKSKLEVEVEFIAAMEADIVFGYSTKYDYMSVKKISANEFMSDEDYLEAELQMMGYYD